MKLGGPLNHQSPFSKGGTDMASTLAFDIARSGLRPFVERVEMSEGLTATEVKDLVGNCTITAALLTHGLNRLQGALDRGIEFGAFRASVDELAGLAEECGRAFDRVRARAVEVTLDSEDMELLAGAERSLAQVVGALTRLATMKGMAVPPLDPSRLPAGRADRTSGDYIGLEEFAARLRARKST
jgi:hypothetical protein